MQLEFYLLFGCKIGIEYVSNEDMFDPEEEDDDVSHMIVLDLLFFRCCLIFFK